MQLIEVGSAEVMADCAEGHKIKPDPESSKHSELFLPKITDDCYSDAFSTAACAHSSNILMLCHLF